MMRCMASSAQIDHIADRVERLLGALRGAATHQRPADQQVEVLSHERDSLKSRLSAARSASMRCWSACPKSRKSADATHG
jgi:cell division protein ZapB